MFRFYRNSPYVPVGMARNGLTTLADLAEYIGEDVADVAEWLSGQYAYPEITSGMSAISGMLDIYALNVFYVDESATDPEGCWQHIRDIEAFHEWLNA